MNLWYGAFLEAAMAADEGTVEMLLKAGVHPDVFDDDHVTALQIAAAQGNLSMMQVLLNGSASVERCNGVGMTALMHACRNGHLEAVELLLANNADRFRTTYVLISIIVWFYGVTALTLAIAGGFLDIVALLQSARCPTQENAPTPLVAAVAKRHHHIIIFLELLSDAPPFINDACLFGLDAVRVAQILGDRQICELLSDLGVTSNVPRPNNRFIPSSAFEPCLSYVKCNSVLLPDIRYLIRDEKVYQLDKMLRRKRKFAPLPAGSTPLMFAAVIGNVDMARVLLRNDVDIDASLENFTAIMIATVCGNDAMVNYLLDMGANKSTNERFCLADLAVESEGIKQSTRERIENGDAILQPKRRSVLTKFFRIFNFRRKKIQAVEHCPGVVSFYGRFAFRERVNYSMGKNTSVVPSRLFQVLICPDAIEYFDDHEVGMVAEQQVNTKCERILDSYSDEDIDRLFRRRNCRTPIAHRSVQRVLRPADESCKLMSKEFDVDAQPQRSALMGSSTTSNEFELTRLDWDGSRLSRNISELRANFFSFDSASETLLFHLCLYDLFTNLLDVFCSSISRRHVSLERPPKRRIRISPDKRNVRYWQNVCKRCSARTCEILKLEEVDESSFTLMHWDDFIDMGIAECDVEKLEELRQEILTERGR
ncbi:unnamed protein product [Toxocara canis]|uniref:ANK_REP_REGION domain-containing protein n=1 Tax=Toxocara canis TaxID=6265 RepID=A0A183UUJ7_TOXCA|nr:unnamed protein product [Toxocara canis]